MTIYEDEWAFWDDIASKYIFKNAGVGPNTENIINAAAFYADSMVIERRRRKAGKIPANEIPRIPATAATVAPMAAS